MRYKIAKGRSISKKRVSNRTAINRINRAHDAINNIVENYQSGLSDQLRIAGDAARKIMTLPGAHSLGLSLIQELIQADEALAKIEVLMGDLDNYESDERWKDE